MNTQAEARFKAAKERLAMSPDDLATLKQFAEAARGFDKRDDAVSAMKAAYQRRPTPELYAELRSICTYPEFQAIAKPPEKPGAAPAPQAGTGAELLPRKPFPLLLDQVIFFPVQDGLSVFILITCAVSMTIGSIFTWAMGGIGIAAALIFFGIVFGYLWTVMHASGMGEKHTRGWPDMANPEEFGAAIGQYYLVSLICFAPALAVLYFQPLGEDEVTNLLAAIGVALIGVLYYPMALMLAGFTHSAGEALNFPSGFRSIGKMPVDYLVCLGFIIFTEIVVIVGQVLIQVTFAEAPIPMRILLGFMIQTASVYLLIMKMRAVGLLYYAREKDLGWFQ